MLLGLLVLSMPLACDIPMQGNSPASEAPYVVITTHADGSLLHRSHSMLDPAPVGASIARPLQDDWIKMDYAWSTKPKGERWRTFAIIAPMYGGAYSEVNWWNTEDLADVPPGTTIFLRATLYTDTGEPVVSPVVGVVLADPVWPSAQRDFDPTCACKPKISGCAMLPASST